MRCLASLFMNIDNIYNTKFGSEKKEKLEIIFFVFN